MADDDAAAALATKTIKDPNPWDSRSMRIVDYLKHFAFHCQTYSIPDDKHAGVLFGAIPASYQATVRRGCDNDGIELQDVTVQQIKKYLTAMPDLADKSQEALRHQLEYMPCNPRKFSAFVDKWNTIMELTLEGDPPIDENTLVYMFKCCLPSRLRMDVMSDGDNKPWTNIRDLQSAASMRVQWLIDEEGPGAFDNRRDHKRGRDSARDDFAPQRQRQNKTPTNNNDDDDRHVTSRTARADHDKPRRSAFASTTRKGGRRGGGRGGGRNGGRSRGGGRRDRKAPRPCRICKNLLLGDKFHWEDECPNKESGTPLVPAFPPIPPTDAPTAAAVVSADTVPGPIGAAPVPLYTLTMNGEPYVYDPSQYMDSPDGDDPLMEELLHLQYLNQDLMPVEQPLLWAALCTAVNDRLQLTGISPPVLAAPTNAATSGTAANPPGTTVDTSSVLASGGGDWCAQPHLYPATPPPGPVLLMLRGSFCPRLRKHLLI